MSWSFAEPNACCVGVEEVVIFKTQMWWWVLVKLWYVGKQRCGRKEDSCKRLEFLW